jgi:heme exporter protein A
MGEMALLSAQGIEKRFGLAPVLRGVDLELFPGELLLLLGPNGAGKTTLTKVLALLSRPSKGKMLFEGREVSERERLNLRRALGYLSHHSFLYAHLTAVENLRFFAGLYGVQGADARILELLERLGLSRAKDQLVGTFSRGMQQRLTLARVLVTDPPVVILDEPYAGLDPEGSRTFTALLQELKTAHRAILLVSHEIEDCLHVVDRVAVLHGGRITWNATASGISPGSLKQKYFEVTAGGAA